jgi:hypothetical protein
MSRSQTTFKVTFSSPVKITFTELKNKPIKVVKKDVQDTQTIIIDYKLSRQVVVNI